MTEQFSPVWFSYKEYRYDAKLKNKQRFFTWTENLDMWDWSNCAVSAVSISDKRVRVIIRNVHTIHSSYIGRDVAIRYMYGFDAAEIPGPELDRYGEPPPKNTLGKQYGKEKERWVIHLRKDEKDDQDNKDCYIWEWADGRKKEETAVYQIYKMLKKRKESTEISGEVFHTSVTENNETMPVIYQPAIDSWKNFVREIHCHKLDSGEYEITVIMNGEQLRKHRIFDWIYRIIRKERYHRLQDVETFNILPTGNTPENFMFSGIYSNNHGIYDDDIHGDRPCFFRKIPIHKIKYYFSNKKHPIVFINTSNHAMAEHDNNHNLWKWEYVGWEPDGPVKLGNKSREDIDKLYDKKAKA